MGETGFILVVDIAVRIEILFSVYGWLCMITVIILLMVTSKFLDINREVTFFLGAIFFCIRNLSALIMRSMSFFQIKYLPLLKCWIQCRAVLIPLTLLLMMRVIS